MTRFSVWAPSAAAVELEVAGRRRAMAPAEGGWFVLDDERAGPGDDYGYRLDGGEPRPDPRSRWQPNGVHGLSRLVDGGAFTWTDQRWHGMPLASAVLYELHVGTFTQEGTFDAAVTRIPYLVELGITAVELMPVAEFPGTRGWGYDGVDLFAPHHAYGGPEGLMRLVDACHAQGLAVVMDVVYNHLGPDGNYLEGFGPYFTDRYRTPWGSAVNVDDAGSDEVRRFIVDNAVMWLRDFHCDGLRLDAVHAIVDTSATHLLEELAVRVRELEAELGRELWVIAESDLNDPRVVRRREAGGYGVDAQWSDDLHHALHVALTGEHDGYYADFTGLADVATALRHVFVYGGRHSVVRGRRHGRRPQGEGGSRFLGYLQNHDQVGNRARGERSAALMSQGRLRIAAALVLTSPFIPMLFAGEEWGAGTPFQYFTDHVDAELGRLVSQGRRREFAAFGWAEAEIPDPQDPQTFARSRLDWSEREREPHASMLRWHRELIRLRRGSPALLDGRLDRVRTRVDEAGGWILVERGPVTVACNLGEAPVRVDVEPARPRRLLLTSAASPDLGGDTVELAGESVLIWESPWESPAR